MDEDKGIVLEAANIGCFFAYGVDTHTEASISSVASKDSSSVGMTYDEACSFQIPFGQYKGKTMGMLAAEKPDQLTWYVEPYRGGNQNLKVAAKIMIESLKAA